MKTAPVDSTIPTATTLFEVRPAEGKLMADQTPKTLETILLACFFYLAWHKPNGVALWVATGAGLFFDEARNGEEAIKVFDQHGDTIDMLLTDMRMPYMGGAELAHHLRERRSSLKLLCISGYPGQLDPDVLTDFLAKPFSRDELLKKVRDVLDRR